MKNKRSKKYFTVLEMLIAMGLLSVIMFTLLSMLDQSQKAMTKGVSRLNVVEEARVVLDQIENDITCVDYAEAVLKDPLRVKKPQDDVLFVANGGESLTVYTTRTGSLPILCRVTYEKRGYNLHVITKEYDMADKSFKTPKNEDPDKGRILLTNVLAFKVHVWKYDNLGKENEYPQQVNIELQLIDDETRQLGYSSAKDSIEKPINVTEIENKIGTDAFKARAARFSRVVSLPPPASSND